MLLVITVDVLNAGSRLPVIPDIRVLTDKVLHIFGQVGVNQWAYFLTNILPVLINLILRKV